MKKKITALLLCLVMAMSLIPTTVWAAEVKQDTPQTPTEAEMLKLGKVQVNCVKDVDGKPIEAGRHGSKTYDLIAGTITTKAEDGTDAELYYDSDSNEWFYTFWLTEEGMWKYVNLFEQETKSAHAHYTWSGITLVYKDKSWQLAENGASIINMDACSTIDKPDLPAKKVIETGEVAVYCDRNYGTHGAQVYPLASGTYYTDETSLKWNSEYTNGGAWVCDVYLRVSTQGADGVSYYVDQFSKTHGKHLATYVYGAVPFIYRYDAATKTGNWELWNEYWDDEQKAWVAAENAAVAIIETACAPTAAELGLNVNVKCAGSKHAEKTYTTANLLADSSLNFQPVFQPAYTESYHGYYQYQASLTTAAAYGYVANYSTAVGKTHTLKDSSYVTVAWSGNDISVNSVDPAADLPGGEVDPDESTYKWKLTDPAKNTIAVTAGCVTTPPNGSTTGTTIKSATTFDAGIALYAGLGILSMTGSALVIRKKKEF